MKKAYLIGIALATCALPSTPAFAQTVVFHQQGTADGRRYTAIEMNRTNLTICYIFTNGDRVTHALDEQSFWGYYYSFALQEPQNVNGD